MLQIAKALLVAVSAAAVLIAMTGSADAAIPPTASDCTLMSPLQIGVVETLASTAIKYSISYTCPKSEEYQISIELRRVGGTYVTSSVNTGTIGAPFDEGRSIPCESANPTEYRVIVDSRVGNLLVANTGDESLQLPCYLPGPGVG